MATYPRVYVKIKTKARFARAAKKEGTTQEKLGDKVVLAGLRALGY
jgi:hypothetical protein